MHMKSSKLAIAVLALSLTQAVNASESTFQEDHDNKGTYWGIGIGSVLGAVIAGPPGAAIGATLGGSIGWGKDQNDTLDKSLNKFGQNELALQERKQVLEKNLQQAEQEMQALKRSNAMQASRFKELQAKQESKAQETEFLERLVAHYTQDIYFRIGQAETPDYAQERLASLVELLKAYPDLHVTLKGYTDPTGSAKLNAALAQARVDSIKQLLSTQGIDDSRISGMADANLVNAQAKKTDHILDRRVAIELHVNDSDKDQPLASLAVLEK